MLARDLKSSNARVNGYRGDAFDLTKADGVFDDFARACADCESLSRAVSGSIVEVEVLDILTDLISGPPPRLSRGERYFFSSCR